MKFVPLVAMCLLLGTAKAGAQENASNLAPPLTGVTWAGPGVNLDALRGKTVVVISYVTWCPICNEWSPELFKQLKEAIADKPVVVIAIATETPTISATEYMKQRNFAGPNIIHGQSETINKLLKLEKANLFNAIIIDPSGKIVQQISAGVYYQGADGKKRFAIPETLSNGRKLGQFDAITPELGDDVKQALWPLELGQVTTDALLGKLRTRLAPADQKAFDASVEKYLENQANAILKKSAGTLSEKLDAYQQADGVTKIYRNRPQLEPVRKLMVECNKDLKFKRELAAMQGYHVLQQQIRANPANQANLLRTFATRFKETHYGELAVKESSTVEP